MVLCGVCCLQRCFAELCPLHPLGGASHPRLIPAHVSTQPHALTHTQDLDHPLNSGGDWAYSPLERALGRLEALTDVPAAARGAHAAVYEARDAYRR